MAMNTGERNETIDFWRGFVLVAIFVNHIPGNLLEHLTFRNIGFSDGAEAFVFIAGLSVALVYFPKLPKGDVVGVVWRCLKRAAMLYRVHILLTFSAMAVFATANVIFELADLIEADGRGSVFNDTSRGITGVFLLGHQLGYFNILPLYVVLLLWAPVALLLVRVHAGLALVVAVAIYVASRNGLALPSWPEPGTWYFNPFSWQLLFTLGILSGVLWREREVPFSPVAMAASGSVMVFAAVSVTDAFGLSPGLWDAVRAALDVDKSNLGLLRLFHFLAMAYVLSQLPLGARLAQTGAGQEVQRLGRNGLAIFAVGSFLSAVGQVTMTLSEVRYSASPHLIGMIFTVLGVVSLFLVGRYLEWSKVGFARQPGGLRSSRLVSS
jgi:hypothetical protein